MKFFKDQNIITQSKLPCQLSILPNIQYFFRFFFIYYLQKPQNIIDFCKKKA